mgnify:CR=1 FL=1
MSHAHLVRASVRSSYQVGGGRTFYSPARHYSRISYIGRMALVSLLTPCLLLTPYGCVLPGPQPIES